MYEINVQLDHEKRLIGLGEASVFELFDPQDLYLADAFLKNYAHDYVFMAISYDLGHYFLNLKKFKKPSSFPLLRLWTADETRIVPNTSETMESLPSKKVSWKARESRETYLSRVKTLKNEIQLGNIYEINYCQEFYAENVNDFNGKSLFQRVQSQSPTPFSVYWNSPNWEVVSASPERFIRLEGNKLISQPIKGTAPRSVDPMEDQRIINQLNSDPKERAENIMIVDLVRNDCSKIAEKNSVQVEELCAIYSFPMVHQMISTVSCSIRPEIGFTEILKALFPMGSMTGAPKRSAVRLSEIHESFSRGLYSGSIGYRSPNGAIDLNVMIRSFIFNKQENYLSCPVGGAITSLSDPEKEFEECQTKVGKLLNLLGTCPW
jgi:para-aminobenzoate synthetase component 1